MARHLTPRDDIYWIFSMLIYAAHLPHSPALLPQIAKNKVQLFKKTKRAIAEIAADLYARNPATLLLITPLGAGLEHSYTLQVASRYQVDLGPIGDFASDATFGGDIFLAHKISEELGIEWPVKNLSNERLDVASSVAMLQLIRAKKNYSILPLTYALQPAKQIFAFGQALREAIEKSGERVAALSLGDLSRTNSREREAGDKFDQKIINCLHDKQALAFLELESPQIDSFHVCAYRPLALLLGALSGVNYECDVLSYQQRFGVGMMAARFTF